MDKSNLKKPSTSRSTPRSTLRSQTGPVKQRRKRVPMRQNLEKSTSSQPKNRTREKRYINLKTGVEFKHSGISINFFTFEKRKEIMKRAYKAYENKNISEEDFNKYINLVEVFQKRGRRIGLFSYKREYEEEVRKNQLLSSIRGAVIDLELAKVICAGSTLPIPVVIDKIPENGIITDSYGNEHNIIIGNATKEKELEIVSEVRPYKEGVYLRAFVWNEQKFLITHNRLFPDGDDGRQKSFISNQRPFIESYKNGGGPTLKTLYPEGVLYSPFVYYFFVTTPLSPLVSMFVDKEIDVAFVGYTKVWEYSLDGSIEGVDENNKPLRYKVGKKSELAKSFGYGNVKKRDNEISSLADANTYLHQGNYKNISKDVFPKALPGESLHVRIKNTKKGIMTPTTLQIMSSSYNFRKQLLQHSAKDGNLYRNYIINVQTLKNTIYRNEPEMYDEYYRGYNAIPLSVDDDQFETFKAEIKNSKDPLFFEIRKEDVVPALEMEGIKLDNLIFGNFISQVKTINPSYQRLMFNFHDRFMYDIEELCKFIKDLIYKKIQNDIHQTTEVKKFTKKEIIEKMENTLTELNYDESVINKTLDSRIIQRLYDNMDIFDQIIKKIKESKEQENVLYIINTSIRKKITGININAVVDRLSKLGKRDLLKIKNNEDIGLYDDITELFYTIKGEEMFNIIKNMWLHNDNIYKKSESIANILKDHASTYEP